LDEDRLEVGRERHEHVDVLVEAEEVGMLDAHAPALKEDDRHRARHLARAHQPLVARLVEHRQLDHRRRVCRVLELAEQRRKLLVGRVDVPARADAAFLPLLL